MLEFKTNRTAFYLPPLKKGGRGGFLNNSTKIPPFSKGGAFPCLMLLFSLSLLSGCSLLPWYKPQVVHTKLVFFQIAEQANRDQSFGFDIVAVHSEELLEKLLAMPAGEWFEKREQLKLDFPAELSTWEWEIVPGQRIPMFKLPRHVRKGQGLLAFARYTTEGEHRARLDPYEAVVVGLQERKLEVKPMLLR